MIALALTFAKCVSYNLLTWRQLHKLPLASIHSRRREAASLRPSSFRSTTHAPNVEGRAGEKSSCEVRGRPNGSDAKLHGQGPRAEARAARGALHVRRANARRVTPCGFDSNEPARPAGRSRAVPASAASWTARPSLYG